MGRNKKRRSAHGAKPSSKQGLHTRRRRKKKNNLLPILGMILFVVLVLGLLGGYFLYRRYSYGTDRADLNTYFGVTDSSSYPVFMDNENSGIYAKNFDGVYYLSLNDIHTYISDRFYYGEADGLFIYTTQDDIITNTVGTASVVSSTAGDISESYTVSRLEDGILYVAIDFVAQFYDITYEAWQEPNRMALYIDSSSQNTALITGDTRVRRLAGPKAEILRDITEGERVVVLEAIDENWTEVRTEDCFIGYIENKYLGDTEQYVYGKDDISEPVYTSLTRSERICLGWHFMVNETGNEDLSDLVSGATGLNVISPTWFVLNDEQGGFDNFGSTAYVTQAHNLGLEVWIAVRNFRDDDLLIDDKALLSSASSRAALISNLISETLSLGADGINLDFEQITQDTGQDYIEFVRELSIACRANGLVYSIDNYVPYHFNDYYDIAEQGIVADYVIIMGYDEHTGGSETAGSVASIEYVRNGIESTVAQVDASKVINAVPFYTRIWVTDSQDQITSSRAVGMDAAREEAQLSGIEFTWDDETAQYYGAAENADGSRTEIWLEDAESINEKLVVMNTNNLGGVAAWRLGLESDDVWSVIASFVN